MSSKDWLDRVVMITHMEYDVTINALKHKFAPHGTIVKAQLAKSGTGKPLGYVSFLDASAADSALGQHGKSSQRDARTIVWLAHKPEGGQWNKWMAPTSVEIRDAKRASTGETQAAASAAAQDVPLDFNLGLDPRDIFFVNSPVSESEQMLELERAFGSAEQSYPSFPLFITTVVKAAEKWLPLHLKRGAEYDAIDEMTRTEFVKACMTNPLWKQFLKRADNLARSPEIVLSRKLEMVRTGGRPTQRPSLSAAPSSSARGPPPHRPQDGPRPTERDDARSIFVRPMTITPRSLAYVLSLIALIDINAEEDVVLSPDGSYAAVRVGSVEQADRAYALINKLQLPWNNERIRLFRTRAFTVPDFPADAVHLNLARNVTVAAAYNSLVRFGAIESCRLGSVQDGSSGGIIVEYEDQDSLLRLEKYYNAHVADREEVIPQHAYRFDNWGEIMVWRVDTLDKWEDLLRQWNEFGGRVGRVVGSSKDRGDRFKSDTGPRYARVSEISTCRKIVSREQIWRADNTDFDVTHTDLLRNGKGGTIELVIKPYGSLPVPAPLALTDYHAQADRIDRWIQPFSDAQPSPAPYDRDDGRSRRQGESPTLDHDRRPLSSKSLTPARAQDESREASVVSELVPIDDDGDAVMSVQDPERASTSASAVESAEEPAQPDPPQSTSTEPPRRARLPSRVRPKPVAYNVWDESVKLVLSEVRKERPEFTRNDAVAALWEKDWLREQCKRLLHEQRVAQAAQSGGAAASGVPPGPSGGA